MSNLSFKQFLFESFAINESFAAAQKVFSKNNDEQTVRDTLEKFKQLSQQGRIKPEYKDITKWMNKPFKELYDFVSKADSTLSNKQLKKINKKDAIKLKEWDDWIAIIPLTTEASCQYGSNTKWCTAATDSRNYFDDYFNDSSITLVYFINKKTNKKYAVAIYTIQDAEYFDEEDHRIPRNQLIHILGLTEDQFTAILSTAKDHDKVKDTRDSKAITNQVQIYLNLKLSTQFISSFSGKMYIKDIEEFISKNKDKIDTKDVSALHDKIKDIQEFVKSEEDQIEASNRRVKIEQLLRILDNYIESFQHYAEHNEPMDDIIHHVKKYINIAKKYSSYDPRIDDIINRIETDYINRYG